MKCFEEMTLEEMNEEEAQRYLEALDSMSSNWLYKRIVDANYGESLIDIYLELEEDTLDYKSELFFSGDIVMLYGKLKERKSKKKISCDFSSGIIYPGDFYIPYRPLVVNIDTKNAYVLEQTLKVSPDFASVLPKNITELEALIIRMMAEKENSDEINYNHLSSVVGGELGLQKLKSRSRR